MYVDARNAVYFGNDAIPIGFNNKSLIMAIQSKVSTDFIAFTIKDSEFLKKVNEDEIKTTSSD